MNTLKKKSVVMIIAGDNFRDEEFTEPFNLLTASGATVKVASSRKTPAKGMLGKQVIPDLLLKDVAATNFDAVIFVGGSGAQEYFDDPAAHRVAREAAEQGKVLAAICIAPATLANAGVLKDKKATCFPSVGNALQKGGATLVRQPVVQDGRLITADGPSSAGAFARSIVAELAK